MTHDYLTGRARRWLANTAGCGVVLEEARGYGLEQPDAIGWRLGRWSYLVECKASRSDFLRDGRKMFRQHPDQGLGAYRFLMAPVGVVKSADELPAGWGWLEVTSRRVLKRQDAGMQAEWNIYREMGVLLAELRKYQVQGIRYKPVKAAPERRRVA